MSASSTDRLTRSTVAGVSLVESDPANASGASPLVFVHGGCHGAWQWAQTQKWFAGVGRRTIALDWYSHGESKRLDEADWVARSILDVADEIRIAVDRAGTPPILVGHSMGGLAALGFAAEFSEMVSGLVLLTPVVPMQFGGDAIELPIDLDRPWGPPPREVAEELFFSGAPAEAKDQIYRLLQPESPRAVWEATRWSAELDVDGVSVPTLVIGAESDPLVPVGLVASLADGLGAEYVELAGTDHGVMFDSGWFDVCARIEEWSERSAPRRD